MSTVHNLDLYPHVPGPSCLGCVFVPDPPETEAADDSGDGPARAAASTPAPAYAPAAAPAGDPAAPEPPPLSPPPAVIGASLGTDLVRRRGEPTVLSAQALNVPDDTPALFRIYERGCEATSPLAVVEGVVHDQTARAEWDGRIPPDVGEELTMTVETAGLVSEALPVPVEPVRHTVILELHDALFRLKSAVLLPEGEAPAASPAEQRSLTTVGLVSNLLRWLQEHPGKKTLVAGHTDTAGTKAYNATLSEDRAACACACLAGDRAVYVDVCGRRHRVGDYKQILSWAARTFGFDCDPGVIDEQEFTGIKPLKRFQKAYNDGGHAGTDHPDVPVDGSCGPKTWGAFFDCYELALRNELGVDAAGLAELRARLVFLDPARPAVGCGENHPIDEVGRDSYRSQTNRRVEVLLFDPGEEPVLACHAGGACAPEQCDLYNLACYERLHLPPMVSAQPWTARFQIDPVSEPGGAGDVAPRIQADVPLVLDAPGLPAGETIVFEVFREGCDTAVGLVEAKSEEGRATTSFDGWYDPDDAGLPAPVSLEAGQPFPELRFFFEARGGGRTVRADAAPYGDYLDGVLRLGSDPVPNAEYTVAGPFGARAGRTDAAGRVREDGLPPGGVSFVWGPHLFADREDPAA